MKVCVPFCLMGYSSSEFLCVLEMEISKFQARGHIMMAQWRCLPFHRLPLLTIFARLESSSAIAVERPYGFDGT